MKYKIIDSHCDSVTRIEDNNLSFYDNDITHINLQKLLKSNVKIQFMAVYIDYTIPFPDSYFKAIGYINKLHEYEKNSDNIKIIKNKSDLDYVMNNDNIVGIIISIEGAHIIDDNIEIIKSLNILGVKSLTLTWNYKNKVACGTMESIDFGLTDFGRSVINTMNNMNIIIDVSHASYKTFYDVLQLTKQPIIASHSLSNHINEHKRNLTDDQIKELSKINGIIGINFYEEFVGKAKNISSLVDHIERIIYIGGSECVGFGSDFDGCNVINPLKDCTYLYLIIDELLKRNYNNDFIKKICYKNYLDLLSKFY
ncbi:dipeptidase [Tepidibacter aestuarii]|uniref:dipeptidase n=1 Tax=Tepidibacter aestuarii TaxID=2925782 RepID=UPI0020C0BF54|nr:membrane dipeptidase [Tepidibacter aestuarii]CAH2213653.1 Membrane dipeptidase [Tepidibacter aestuarii]CAH2215659.1 Membrane dipeptidase [Tepidibacter aestuarii]